LVIEVINLKNARNLLIILIGAILLSIITMNTVFAQTDTSTDTSTASAVVSIVACLVCLFIPAIGFIVLVGAFILFLSPKARQARAQKIKNDVNTHSVNAQPVSKPVYDVNQLVRDLTLGDPQLQSKAAVQLKEVNQPLLLDILQISAQEYLNYQNNINKYNDLIEITPYGTDGWVLSFEILQKISEGAARDMILFHERRWKSTLEGAELYIFVSSESADTGIIELILTVMDNADSPQIVEQGQYVIKYIGITIVEPLIQLYNNPDDEIRAGTILLLSVLDDVRSYDTIRKALSDESPEVRNVAAMVIKTLDIPLEYVNKETIQKETIREIVKMPCKYCGTYIENTATYCPSCGAPLGK